MDQIAIIADIHGNLPALESVLEDIDRRRIDRVFCLGDLAGKGPSGAKVVDLCRSRCEVIILGNWETLLAQPQETIPFQWWQEELGQERCHWLGTLPFSYDFMLSGQRVRLVHSSPQGVFQRVFQRAPDDQLQSMFESTDLTDRDFQPNVVCYADTHTPFVRTFPNQTLINVGSVGNPIHSSAATYCILEGWLERPPVDLWSVQVVRVPYNIDQVILDAREAGAPEQPVWEFELTTGKSRLQMIEAQTT